MLRRGSTSDSAGDGGGSIKHSFSIYTVMLMIALAALVVGCILLYLEINSYGGFGAVGGA